VAQIYPRAVGSLSIASYNSQGYAEVFCPASTRDWADFDATSWHYIIAIVARTLDPSKLHLFYENKGAPLTVGYADHYINTR
jgi:hypothetical protein